jgi:hypothetical protein
MQGRGARAEGRVKASAACCVLRAAKGRFPRRGPGEGARKILPKFSNSCAKPPEIRDFYRFLSGGVYGEGGRGGKEAPSPRPSPVNGEGERSKAAGERWLVTGDQQKPELRTQDWGLSEGGDW